MSNQPNLSNKIGNGAKIFELINPDQENVMEHDPFQENEEFQDIEESQEFSQYRTVNETYKSVGSLHK